MKDYLIGDRDYLEWKNKTEGETSLVELKPNTCPHRDVYFKESNLLVCKKCGTGWSGPVSKLLEIKDLLTKA